MSDQTEDDGVKKAFDFLVGELNQFFKGRQLIREASPQTVGCERYRLVYSGGRYGEILSALSDLGLAIEGRAKAEQEPLTSENQVVCAVCDGEKPFDEHAAGCPLHPDVRPSKTSVRPKREEFPLGAIGDIRFANALCMWQYDEIERLRAIARPGDAAAFEEYAAARGVPLDTAPASNPMSPQLAGLVNRLQEWSRNCLIDGLKMDAGEPTLQALLREAYLTLMRAGSPVETSGCTRSHSHELMSRECELLTEIARSQNALRRISQANSHLYGYDELRQWASDALAAPKAVETDAGLIAALHLLAGQVTSPIHAETARRAIAALGGGTVKAIETKAPHIDGERNESIRISAGGKE